MQLIKRLSETPLRLPNQRNFSQKIWLIQSSIQATSQKYNNKWLHSSSIVFCPVCTHMLKSQPGKCKCTVTSSSGFSVISLFNKCHMFNTVRIQIRGTIQIAALTVSGLCLSASQAHVKVFFTPIWKRKNAVILYGLFLYCICRYWCRLVVSLQQLWNDCSYCSTMEGTHLVCYFTVRL